MAQFEIPVSRRTIGGKEATKRLREEGKIPAVLYGHGEEPVMLSVDFRTFSDHIAHHGTKTLLVLSGDGGGETAFIKSTQKHYVKNTVQSIDLIRVSRTEKIHVKVPVILDGEPLSVRTGDGVLAPGTHEVEIIVSASDVPEAVHIDVSGLELDGPALHVSDITLPAGVELVTSGEESVATVNYPATVEQEGGDVVAEGEEATAEASQAVEAEFGGPASKSGEGLESGHNRSTSGKSDGVEHH